MDGHLVITAKSTLAKSGCPCQVRGKILNVQDRVPVRGGDAVEAAKISTVAPTPINLGHRVEWRSPGTVRGAHDSKLLHSRELPLGDSQLGSIEPPFQFKNRWPDCGDVVSTPCLATVAENVGTFPAARMLAGASSTSLSVVQGYVSNQMETINWH